MEGDIMKNEKSGNGIPAEMLGNVAGGSGIMDEIYDTAAFTIKLLQSKKVDKAVLEEIIRKLQNNEITQEEIEQQYL